MKITWEGRDWQFNWMNAKTSVVRTVSKETGIKWPGDLMQAAGELDPLAVMGLVWMMKTLNGWQGTLDECDVEMIPFMQAFQDGWAAENPEEPETDPQTPVAEDGSSPTTSPSSESST